MCGNYLILLNGINNNLFKVVSQESLADLDLDRKVMKHLNLEQHQFEYYHKGKLVN